MSKEKTIKSVDEASGCSRRRRTMLALLAGAAVAGKAHSQPAPSASNRPACILTPRQAEGPFFLDQHLLRSDIRIDSTTGQAVTGIPLTLQLRVLAADSACSPVSGAMVEIWHCNAGGVYSGVRDPRFGMVGSDFLRGHQVTGNDGVVRFVTIYPGWYPGRAVHVHVKLSLAGDSRQRTSREWTSQLYFDDAVTDRVHAHRPYAQPNRRRDRNDHDALFRHGGNDLLLDLVSAGDGYIGRFDLGLRSL